MPAKPNVYALLKNVDAFVKRVPINPRSKNYRQWLKNREETRKALREVVKLLRGLQLIREKDLRGLPVPCRVIPLRIVMERIQPCHKIPLRFVEPSFIKICGKIPLRDVFNRLERR